MSSKKYLAQMPDFIGHAEVKALDTSDTSMRARLIQRIQTISDTQLKQLAAFMDSL